MIVYFADRGMNILELASTSSKNGLIIDNDEKVQDVDTGAATFEFDVYFNESNRTDAINATEAGNYILRSNGDEHEFYTIIDKEVDTKTMSVHIYAEDAGLDLLNEVTDSDYTQNTTARTIDTYINSLIHDTGFEIGLNEVSPSKVKILQWEAGNTVTAQLDTVANSFEAELSFSFEIKGLMVTKKIINIHNKRGNTDVTTIRLDSEVDNIKIKSSVANLATCYRVVGGTPEGAESPVTLIGYTYDDGDFYVSSNGWLKSRNALSKWSRYRWEQGLVDDVGHIVKNFSSELTDQKSLLNSALSSLKKVCDIQTEYEIDISLLPDDVKIGDTINIVDEKHKLYVNARVLKLQTKVAEHSSTATLGSYKLKQYDISEKLQKLSEEFVKSNTAQRAYANKVQKLAKEAQDKADAANTLANEANTKANEAKLSAQDAIIAATDAYNKASDAITSSNQANQSANEAKESASDALSKIDSATSDLNKAKENIKNLQTDISNTNKSLDDLAKEAGETKETLDGLSGDLQETKETLELSYAKKTDLSSTEASLKTEITKSATELSAEIEKTYAGKSEVTEIQGKLQSQITQNADGLTSQASKIEKLQNDTTDAQEKITAATKAATKAQETANTAQTAADAAKTAASEAQTAADAAATNAMQAQQKADDAQATAETANTRLAAAEKDLDTAKANLENVTTDVTATKEQVKAAQDAVAAAEANVNKALQDASNAQNAAKKAQTAADDAKTAADNAQTTADTAKANADEAVEAANIAKETAQKAQETVAGLTKRITDAETKINQNSESITAAARKVTEIGDKLVNDYYSKTDTDALLKIESDKIETAVTKVEEINGVVTKTETKANQLSDKFSWLVKSGDSETDFILTDRTATLVSQFINLNGLVTADGLATDAIKSKNYVAGEIGSFLNLADGTFDSKNLKWNTLGEINATAGTIGGWTIDNTSISTSDAGMSKEIMMSLHPKNGMISRLIERAAGMMYQTVISSGMIAIDYKQTEDSDEDNSSLESGINLSGGIINFYTKTSESIGAIEVNNSNSSLNMHAPLLFVSSNGRSSSWAKGRDNAMLKMPTVSGYSPFASIKTTNGSWEIGTYDQSSWLDYLVFSYIQDSDYKKNNNTPTKQITFGKNGVIGGTATAAQQANNAYTLNGTHIKAWNDGDYIGFYNSNGDRKAWIGLNGTNNFQINNSEGNNLIHCNSKLYANLNDSSRIEDKVIARTLSDGNGTYYTILANNGSKEYIHVGLINGGAVGIDCWRSDARLKTNIEYSEVDALSIIDSIMHRSFNWKEDGSFTENGYIAQELEQINEDFVIKLPQSRNIDGKQYFTGDYRYQVSSSSIIPYLSKGIQELHAKVKDQQNEIDELKSMVLAQQEQINELKALIK